MSGHAAPTPAPAVLGWDVGGAHLKSVALGAGGEVLYAAERPTPLWQGLASLEQAFDTVLREVSGAPRHVLTMSGELADCFDGRDRGVIAIVELAQAKMPAGTLSIYAGPSGFIAPQACAGAAAMVASANWHATATHAARRLRRGLLIDVGSTTTDVIAFERGRLLPEAYTDAQRLAAGTLVYTGVTRTPVCAVAPRAPVGGTWRTLAAELFATMADVHRLTGALPEGADLLDTADGRGKSPAHSAARLARMAGADAGDAEAAVWTEFATFIARRQREQIADAISQVLSAHPSLAGAASELNVTGAGTGRFVAERIAAELGFSYTSYAALFPDCGERAGELQACAPAAAVAALALTA